MPEGDTVWRTAHRLDEALGRRALTLCDLRWPTLATADLTGASTTEVVARGKHVLHRLDSGLTLHSHLRMEGSWRIERTARLTSSQLRGQAVRAVVGASDWTAIGLRLGMLDLVATSDEVRLVGYLGPDILGPDWDPDRAAAALTASRAPVGAALLDQRILAGVGTFWAAEALFVHRVPPWAPADEVPQAQVARILRWLHATMRRACAHAVQSSTGVLRAGETSYVHGRSGRPCRRCGGGVRVAMVGEAPRERTMFYCPSCQGGLGPGDDGVALRPLGSGPRRRGEPVRPRRRPDRGRPGR